MEWRWGVLYLYTTKDLDVIGEVSVLRFLEGSKSITKRLIAIVFVTKWGFDQGDRKSEKALN